MKELIKVIIKRIIWFFNKYRYKSRIGRNCNISIDSTLGGKNKIGNNVILGRCEVGIATYIGNNSVFVNTVIGKYSSIASNVQVISGEHPSKIFVSTHPAFFSLLKQSGFTYVNKQLFKEFNYKDEKNKIQVIIGNDVWIGDGVKILSGIKIGDGAIVGTGALVTRDLEPYSIYVGIPAKKIGDRFSEKEKEFLLDYKWWNKDEKWIKKNVDIFRDITIFMKILSNENENEGEKV